MFLDKCFYFNKTSLYVRTPFSDQAVFPFSIPESTWKRTSWPGTDERCFLTSSRSNWLRLWPHDYFFLLSESWLNHRQLMLHAFCTCFHSPVTPLSSQTTIAGFHSTWKSCKTSLFRYNNKPTNKTISVYTGSQQIQCLSAPSPKWMALSIPLGMLQKILTRGPCPEHWAWGMLLWQTPEMAGCEVPRGL